MTTAEYLQTPETVLPRELVYGALRVAESPSTSHQRSVRDLVLSLAPWVRDHQLGEVFFAPMDVILDAAEGLVVQPDLLFVSAARQQIVSDRVFGPPDLVVEVLSPHPRIGKLDERVGWFARYGVRECWLVDQEARAIAVLSLAGGRVVGRTLHRDADRLASSVLPEVPVTPLDVLGF